MFSLFGLRFYIYEVLGQKEECVMFSFVFILIATHSSNPSPGVDLSEEMIISFPAT